MDEARFGEIELAFYAAQDGVVDAAFVAQADGGFAFDAQGLERELGVAFLAGEFFGVGVRDASRSRGRREERRERL